ncbi:hypothetical protein AB433_01615 [Croceicoccus naphthovorans]|uniref:Uncharacterized protein n=2 Tax=Croceicoccus naphthovorans TaxID=1348774 RepID=A0A0G3XEC6_9SPHN|nr:hypothetical protein AB433_01615 [Croceicoccus naphthovorans]
MVVVGGLGLLFAIAARNTRRQINTTFARRKNLEQSEFLALMYNDCAPEAAEFLWETTKFYLAPRLTPHPDDDLFRDLPIDDEDWSIDWPRDFARQYGFSESDLPEWPKEQPVTIRNYGRWLSTGIR